MKMAVLFFLFEFGQGGVGGLDGSFRCNEVAAHLRHHTKDSLFPASTFAPKKKATLYPMKNSPDR